MRQQNMDLKVKDGKTKRWDKKQWLLNYSSEDSTLQDHNNTLYSSPTMYDQHDFANGSRSLELDGEIHTEGFSPPCRADIKTEPTHSLYPEPSSLGAVGDYVHRFDALKLKGDSSPSYSSPHTLSGEYKNENSHSFESLGYHDSFEPSLLPHIPHDQYNSTSQATFSSYGEPAPLQYHSQSDYLNLDYGYGNSHQRDPFGHYSPDDRLDFDKETEQPLDLSTSKRDSFSPNDMAYLNDYDHGGDFSLKEENEENAWLKKIKTGTRSRVRSPKSWEFLLRLLNDPRSNPSMIKWEDEHSGTFRLVQKDEIAKIWGMRSSKHKDGGLSYDNFARNLRYHYKTKMLVPVSEKHLVYKFSKEVMEKWPSIVN